jgi:protein SCO1/2
MATAMTAPSVLRCTAIVPLLIAVLSSACRPSAEPAATIPTHEPVALQDFDLGGDFVLQSHTGGPFRLSSLRGQVVLLFFGYTYCPDVCPTTVATMAQVQRLLGPRSERVVSLFVSVDPERDTVERLREYVGHFESRMVAVTGTAEQLHEVVKKYGAYYEKAASDSASSYTVDHTSRVYLIDAQGRVRYLFRYGDEAALIAQGVELALGE